MARGHPGRVAVITGAATGIGRHFAGRLAEEGVHVAVADISDGAETVAKVVETGRIGRACDVSEPGEVSKLADEVLTDFGRCDILMPASIPTLPFPEFPSKTGVASSISMRSF